MTTETDTTSGPRRELRFTLGFLLAITVGAVCCAPSAAPHNTGPQTGAPPTTRPSGQTPTSAEPVPPPPPQRVFPANPRNQRRFEYFAKMEEVDPEWAPGMEQRLRKVAKKFNSPRRQMMHVECRAETCAVGYIAWRSSDKDMSPQWLEIQWAGSTGGRIESRPDGWDELIFILTRSRWDYPSSSPRVDSLGDPRTDPDCARALPDVRPKQGDYRCPLVVGFASNALCFANSEHPGSGDACSCCRRGRSDRGCNITANQGPSNWIRCRPRPGSAPAVFYNE